MLHVTNGDHAAERIAAALPGDVLPWRDILHEGPVPADLDDDALRATRAEFLAGAGGKSAQEIRESLRERDERLAAEKEEIVLWFEPDLYDQLQLLQVLDRLSRPDLERAPVTQVAAAERMGGFAEPEARAHFTARGPLPAGARERARIAWAEFREPDPSGIASLAGTHHAELPFLQAALRRLLEELPWTKDGLSRSERQALETVRGGRLRADRAFLRSHHAREDRVYLGDLAFYALLDRLASGDRPLLRVDPAPATAESRVGITDEGRAVLEGRTDWIALGGADRWLGGVHLDGADAPWRWDAAAERVTRSPASPRDPGTVR